MQFLSFFSTEVVDLWRTERLNELNTSERKLSDLVSSAKEAGMYFFKGNRLKLR
jgi:hypothetical protein